MANAPCLRCSSLVLPSLTPTSSSQSLSLASHTYLPSWKLIGNKYSTKKSLGKVKAVYANEFWAPETSSSQGIWDDLRVPSSPYFPAYAQGHEPPPMVQERFQSRIIRCGGAVDDDMSNILVAQLLYLDVLTRFDIVMYVSSPGGSVTAGMAIFDTMRHIRPDVSTVCIGLAASKGAFLLSAGTKGKRYSLPNSRIMIHQPLSGQGGQTDIDIQNRSAFCFCSKWTKLVLSIERKFLLGKPGYLSYHTGQSLEKINQDTDCDFFMNAKEAKEYEFIDGVIMNPLKALQPLPAAVEGKDRDSI
ncbi:hypothetical protein JHK87_008047 [Glycine soja]|nr:hypothetical protein JHK87_008047 [Glycine soja]